MQDRADFTLQEQPENHLMVASLKTVKCIKDLGIMVSSDIHVSWSEHVNATVNKANKLLGLVYRTLGSYTVKTRI